MDFLLAVSFGLIAGHTLVGRHGLNPDIDTDAAEDIWGGGGNWVPPTAARIHQITSSSTDDDSGGTGAITVKVEGLDSNYDEIEETITMNGTSNVPTDNSYTMIQDLEVLTAGSGGENAGVITATADIDGTISNQIAAGINRDELCAYMVPNKKTAYVVGYLASIGKGAGKGDADVIFLHKDFSVADSVYTRIITLGLLIAGTSAQEFQHFEPTAHTVQDVIKARAMVGGNNTEIEAGFDLLVIDD